MSALYLRWRRSGWRVFFFRLLIVFCLSSRFCFLFSWQCFFFRLTDFVFNVVSGCFCPHVRRGPHFKKRPGWFEALRFISAEIWLTVYRRRVVSDLGVIFRVFICNFSRRCVFFFLVILCCRDICVILTDPALASSHLVFTASGTSDEKFRNA